MNPDFESLKSEAAAWIVRLTSGAATDHDADSLKRWRALSPDHERAFREAARLWQGVGHAAAPPARKTGITRRAVLSGSLAASGLLAAAGLSELGYLPSLDALTADHATAVGEQQVVTLPDGSVATLDGGSAIALDFSKRERRLVLRAGAAVFEVRPEAERPFVVVAATGITETAGGSFAVDYGPAEVSVDCLGGDVAVACVDTIRLTPGEGVRYSERGISDVTTSDAEMSASWRKGLLTFRNRAVADVVSDLNRHRRGRVVVADRAAGARRITGVFHLKRPEEILSHLETTLRLRRVDMPGGIVLLI
ncbi:FecR family protein [Shinella sp.]|uniref:FecR family protein n=1 Tax=Shinella sp. TaxID=1870904 RepID=UPI003F723957